MTDRDALSLGLKVTGFAWILYCVNAAHNAMHSLCFINLSYDGKRVYPQTYPLRIAAYLAIAVLIAVVLLAFCDSLARLIIRHEKDLCDKTVFSTAIGLVGVVITSISLLSLYSSLADALWIGENRTILSGVWMVGRNWGLVVQAGVTLAIGLCIACWHSRIADFIYNQQITSKESYL